MRSYKSSDAVGRRSKLWLATGAAGCAIAAIFGMAAAAWAGSDTPVPTNSDDNSYQQAPTVAPSAEVATPRMVDGNDAVPGRPADMTPDEVQRLLEEATRMHESRQGPQR